MDSIFEEVSARVAKVIDEWKAANADKTLTAVEVGMLIVHAAQSLAWLMGMGQTNADAVKLAATRLYDEILVPMVLARLGQAVVAVPWYLLPLKWIAPAAMSKLTDAGRTRYIELIEGILTAFARIVDDERADAQAIGAAMARGQADPQVENNRRRNRRTDLQTIRKGKAIA